METKFTYLELERKGKFFYVIFDCPKHGRKRQNYQSHLKGHGCGDCHNEQRGESFESLVERFREIHGDRYQYVEMIRVNSVVVISAICPEHGPITIRASSHKVGEGCFKCGRASAGEKLTEDIQQYVEKIKTRQNTKYTYGEFVGEGKRRRIQVFCPKHGMFLQRKDGALVGKGCPKCRGAITKPNLEIQKLLEKAGVRTELEFRLPGTNKKLDVYAKDKLIGIEYHGNNWHSSKYVKNNNTHKIRLQEARAAGMRLIQIFSDEWTYRNTACRLLLSRACGVPEETVNARSCQVVEVSHKTASAFLDIWHIQGATNAASSYLGLQHAGELVAVIGFSHNTSSRRERASIDKAELTRYATSKNVRGGFTKLLSNWCRQHTNIKEIVTYSDDRLFLGTMYAACGFKQTGKVPIDYTYLDGKTDKRMRKSRFQKSALRKMMGDSFDPNKTELELTAMMKLYRIYDCGKTRWTYHPK